MLFRYRAYRPIIVRTASSDDNSAEFGNRPIAIKSPECGVTRTLIPLCLVFPYSTLILHLSTIRCQETESFVDINYLTVICTSRIRHQFQDPD